jgi:hypothetical protein
MGVTKMKNELMKELVSSDVVKDIMKEILPDLVKKSIDKSINDLRERVCDLTLKNLKASFEVEEITFHLKP